MTLLDVLHPSVEHDSVDGFETITPWASRLARDELVVGGRRVRLGGSRLVRRDERGSPSHGMLGAHPGWSVHEVDADGHAAPHELVRATGAVTVPIAFG